MPPRRPGGPLTLPRALSAALQEKVAEVEARLREQLADTKRRLNQARREQAEAGETGWGDLGAASPSRPDTRAVK